SRPFFPGPQRRERLDLLGRGVQGGVERSSCRATLLRRKHGQSPPETAQGDTARKEFTELKADGGASVDDLLMQLQADAIGIPVRRPKVLETTALGASSLAGLGTGVWSDRAEVASHWQLDREFAPSEDRTVE